MKGKNNFDLMSRQRQALIDFLSGGIDAVTENFPDLVSFVETNKLDAPRIIQELDNKLTDDQDSKFFSEGSTFSITPPPEAPNI